MNCPDHNCEGQKLKLRDSNKYYCRSCGRKWRISAEEEEIPEMPNPY